MQDIDIAKKLSTMLNSCMRWNGRLFASNLSVMKSFRADSRILIFSILIFSGFIVFRWCDWLFEEKKIWTKKKINEIYLYVELKVKENFLYLFYSWISYETIKCNIRFNCFKHFQYQLKILTMRIFWTVKMQPTIVF